MTVAKRSARARLMLVVMSLAIAFVSLEIALRGVYFVKNRAKPTYSVLSNSYGWSSAPNRKFSYFKDNYGEVFYSTNADGFRTFGDVKTSKTRILFVGDSFTQAYHVSDGKAYFDVLGHSRPDVEVFAYGAGGYGTLQELMALERFMPLVRPDIVVLQVHANDIVNNDFALESMSRENNNHMRRPYYEGGQVVFRHPDGAFHLLSDVSLVARRLVLSLDSILLRLLGTVENDLGPSHLGLQRSLATTQALLEKADASAGEAALIVLIVASGDDYPYEPILEQELCGERPWKCIENLEERLDAARNRGIKVDGGSDAHWNSAGHEIAAGAVEDFLVASELLPVTEPRTEARTED